MLPKRVVRSFLKPHAAQFAYHLAIPIAAGATIQSTRPSQTGSRGDLAQMVERSLSMREALGSMPRFSSFCLSLTSNVTYCVDGVFLNSMNIIAARSAIKHNCIGARVCVHIVCPCSMQTAILDNDIEIPTRETLRRHCVREVKELDLTSNGLCPHGFEPHRCRFLLRCPLLFLT